jgi:aminoglycoside phosphotransferase (APT) family kinase protein
MIPTDDLPSEQSVRNILELIAPGYTGFRVQTLSGSFSNHTHLVHVEFADGGASRIVVRRYNEANGDCEAKALREFNALAYLHSCGIPVPNPLYLDAKGYLLGSPGIVTGFVDSKHLELPENARAWADNIAVVAQVLARIHQTSIDEQLKMYLMDGNREAAWFLNSGSVPRFMRDFPGGAEVWEAVSEHLPLRKVPETALLHIDYWSGNILWHERRISAVVDWEEAGYGDPAIDVAYCRMQLYLEGLNDAAETFTRVYEQAMGRPVDHLALWELAAAARPMTDPEGWFTRTEMRERFQAFIESAKLRAGE